MPRYVVNVDENDHFMDADEQWTLGVFDTPEEAIAAAQRLIDISLRAYLAPGMTPERLYAAYTFDGDDPFIVVEGGGIDAPPFSAWDYARARAVELCAAEVALGSSVGTHFSGKPAT